MSDRRIRNPLRYPALKRGRGSDFYAYGVEYLAWYPFADYHQFGELEGKNKDHPANRMIQSNPFAQNGVRSIIMQAIAIHVKQDPF
jgi:hypothetical protein